MSDLNTTLRMRVARYLTSHPELKLDTMEKLGVITGPEERRLAEQFVREAITAVMFVADQDEKRLKADRESGEYREAVEKLVDGVVEDIKLCRHPHKQSAQTAAVNAVQRSDWVADPALNMLVLQYGTHPSAYFYRVQTRSPLGALPWQAMAQQCMWYDVHEELSRRPEFVSLPLPAA